MPELLWYRRGAERVKPIAMDRVVTAEKPVAADRTSLVQRLADGRRIGYAEFGDAQGAAVIAIHGTPGSRLMFALTDRAARERRLRIIAPERPGYGLSDFHPKQTLKHAADDMKAFVDALGLDRFAVIGVSGGAPYAVATAAAMGDRIALLSPVGPIADCHATVRMSRLHRLMFTRLGRSAPSCIAFFWSLRQLVRFAPDVASRA